MITQEEGEEVSESLEEGLENREESGGDQDGSGSLVTSSASLPSQPPTPKGAAGGRAKAEPAKIRPARRCLLMKLKLFMKIISISIPALLRHIQEVSLLHHDLPDSQLHLGLQAREPHSLRLFLLLPFPR